MQMDFVCKVTLGFLTGANSDLIFRIFIINPLEDFKIFQSGTLIHSVPKTFWSFRNPLQGRIYILLCRHTHKDLSGIPFLIYRF